MYKQWLKHYSTIRADLVYTLEYQTPDDYISCPEIEVGTNIYGSTAVTLR